MAGLDSTPDGIHKFEIERSKGGYEVWNGRAPATGAAKTWMTRMGAERERERLINAAPSLKGKLTIVYIHVLSDKKKSE